MDRKTVKLISGPVAEPELSRLPGIFERAFRVEAPGFYAPEEIEAALAAGAGPASTMELFAAGDCVTLRAGERVIGCGAVAVGGADYDGTPILPGTAVIRAVAIEPAWSGLGWGRRLMAELVRMAQARGAREIRLTATLCALSFYRRLGYVPDLPVTLDLCGMPVRATPMRLVA